MEDRIKRILKIAAIIFAAATVATTVTMAILKFTKKRSACSCAEKPGEDLTPAATELPEEYRDFADVENV